MSWSSAQLAELHDAQEVVLVMHREGHPVKRLPVWVIVEAPNVFVRSWGGKTSVWFRRATADPAQEISLDGRDIPVTFESVGDMDEIAIADGYRAKYGRSGEAFIDAMVSPKAVLIRCLDGDG